MSKPDINITCPNCENEINVDEILYHQLEDGIKKKYQSQISIARKEYEQKEEKLKTKSIELEKKEKGISENIESQLKEKLSIQKKEITSKIKRDIEHENEEKYKTLQSELAEKSEKLKELNQTKSQVEKLKREKNELRQEIELENQKKLTEILQDEQTKIAKREAEKNELKVSEKENIINQLKEQLSIAQRKAEQGSMQLQGEVQELGIEEWLNDNFPFDEILEIKKGQRGADSLQIIKTRTNANCGSIYYESKRTKEFQSSWIEKFKTDMRDRNANIGVLVTSTMPNGMERMGLMDGVWVCSYQEFKGLCFVLRENLINISNATISQENKGDKMVMLYDFLASNEFKLQIEAIVEGFTQMQTDLEREKRSIQGHWKKREKQIDKVILNTNYMYSSIKGIAGNAIQSIPQLELPKPENDNSKE
ncbi:DUF2130 domain-containing protein [uncultured Aquimarina sp.]|uniref:DUF2130 domain-containing protein n=1 Tax=uncultured Aquimarina sp. TaxID=575652 RepID=UPI002603A74E|nr:DUF2130 domain-containing protein [uncultured Aquimarina sp.]